MTVRAVKASDSVEADRGRISITRGPIVYCVEGNNPTEQVQQLFLDKVPENSYVAISRQDTGILKSIPQIEINFQQKSNGVITKRKMSLIPYYAWNNRGVRTMQVWMPLSSGSEDFQ